MGSRHGLSGSDTTGPVNWLAVIAAAVMAGAMGFGWYRMVLPPRASQRPVSLLAVTLAMLASSIMLGHNFARIGAATLAAKPWLYWMMSVGFALWFVVPALYVATTRQRAAPREWVLECLGWLLAYAAMGTVFWGLG